MPYHQLRLPKILQTLLISDIIKPLNILGDILTRPQLNDKFFFKMRCDMIHLLNQPVEFLTTNACTHRYIDHITLPQNFAFLYFRANSSHWTKNKSTIGMSSLPVKEISFILATDSKYISLAPNRNFPI